MAARDYAADKGKCMFKTQPFLRRRLLILKFDGLNLFLSDNRLNYSCETRLLSLFQDLASNPSQIDMIIMDFSKAFDKVPHRRLNYKLDWYGIRGNTREWILDFLSGRYQ